MRRAIADFFWGTEEGKKNMHWRSWEWLSSPKQYGGLGFRDLVLFNQAMLGRQCWRLLTEPNSLCARVLKGRYFPETDFWHASKPRSSSYTWRSILFGKELIKQGIRWGIGDGKTTRLLSDHWIPEVAPGFLKPRGPIPEGASVSLIMDSDRMIWDTDRIQTLFDEETAAKILQVPISRHGGEDFVSWPYTKNGAYSVRSAYHLARTEAFYLARSMPKQGLSSTREDEAPLWKKLWAIKAPGKMKITLWRFIHDCLPSGHQLKHRHIPAPDACVYCGRMEHAVHTMMFCQFARDVWNELKAFFSIKLQRKNFINPKV
jgi:hypothetical protein